MSNLVWAAKLFDDLPEDAVITDAVAVVSYIVPSEDDNDNGVRWGGHFSSDSPTSTNIGLLALAQHHLMHNEKWEDSDG